MGLNAKINDAIKRANRRKRYDPVNGASEAYEISLWRGLETKRTLRLSNRSKYDPQECRRNGKR